MGVVHLPPHSRWVADARRGGRRLRVSAHPADGVVVLSVWDHDRCVATAHLNPDEAAAVAAVLAQSLADLATAAGRRAGTG